MIDPSEIQAKAARLFPEAVDAWLADDKAFFPRVLRANLDPPLDVAQRIESVRELRAGSKESRGVGYTIEWETIKSTRFGLNDFPRRILFESMADLAAIAKRDEEFERLEKIRQVLESRMPSLLEWLKRNWRRSLPLHDRIGDLILVVDYLRHHPRPNCFPRELPLPISTKLIEENEAILREWLDQTLPHDAIDFGAGENAFAERYGFRKKDKLYLLRILDPMMVEELRLPCDELGLPRRGLKGLPVRDATVFVVENQVNLLTMPPLPRSIAFGGLGYEITRLFDLSWLDGSRLFYWGDLDLDGLAILGMFRHRYPQVQSLFMDQRTLERCRGLAISDHATRICAPSEHLHAAEREAWETCFRERLRLEQERLPQSFVLEEIALAIEPRIQ